jgi:hypothetical protein
MENIERENDEKDPMCGGNEAKDDKSETFYTLFNI